MKPHFSSKFKKVCSGICQSHPLYETIQLDATNIWMYKNESFFFCDISFEIDYINANNSVRVNKMLHCKQNLIKVSPNRNFEITANFDHVLEKFDQFFSAPLLDWKCTWEMEIMQTFSKCLFWLIWELCVWNNKFYIAV